MIRFTILAIASLAAQSTAQTLLERISLRDDLSNFTAFYLSNERFAALLYGNTSLYPMTVLVPNDDAFTEYKERFGIALTEVSPEVLLPLVQYHTLVANLTKDDFDSQKVGGSGTTIPTLMDSTNNNRSVGTALAGKYGGSDKAKGQVVVIKSNTGSSGKKFLLSRQSDTGSSVRSGLDLDVNLEVLEDSDNTWDGGRFHVIDSLLTPPDLCKTTIRGAGLANLDRALNRSGLWSALDGGQNLTCLGPNNDAFKGAGNPDEKYNETELAKAIKFHTLPQVAYSDYLEDGMEFQSLQNMTVRVKVEGDGDQRQIWFNNAKVIDANVLTHNGLMHVLDAVMEPLKDDNTTTSATPTPTPTPSSTASSTTSAGSSGAASALEMGFTNWTLLGALGLMVVMEGLGVGALGGRLME